MTAGVVRRSYCFRFYPTDSQAAELVRTFGCVRKAYNLALEARSSAWLSDKCIVSYYETSAMLTAWKKTEDLRFLAEVSSVPLQQALRHLDAAFKGFWTGRSRFPRYKSKRRSRLAAEYTRSGFRWRNGQLTLAKMRDPLKIVWSRALPDGTTPSTVTVTQDKAGRWFVTLVAEDSRVERLPPVDSAVGIDLGITSLITLSTGDKVANPRHEQRERERISRAHRRLSRTEPGGRNRAKARLRLAKIYARVRDRRRDFLHKLTSRLVRENQTIVIEDLKVRNMVKNHALARAITDAAWFEFRSMLEYKTNWYGRCLVVIDMWSPTSKTCSACGRVVKDLPLNARMWRCDWCYALHDRDINAAQNILAAGLAVSACGDDVRPRQGSPAGQSSAKQENRRVTVGHSAPREPR